MILSLGGAGREPIWRTVRKVAESYWRLPEPSMILVLVILPLSSIRTPITTVRSGLLATTDGRTCHFCMIRSLQSRMYCASSGSATLVPLPLAQTSSRLVTVDSGSVGTWVSSPGGASNTSALASRSSRRSRRASSSSGGFSSPSLSSSSGVSRTISSGITGTSSLIPMSPVTTGGAIVTFSGSTFASR